MDTTSYFESLANSSLPLSPWMALAIGVALSIAGHVAFARALSASEQQDATKVDRQVNASLLSTRHVLARAMFGVVLFIAGMWLGETAFAFFFGGFLVAKTVSLASSIRACLVLASMRDPAAKTGTVQFPAGTAITHQAYQIGSSAFLTLCAGLILGNLPLLGATLILGSSAGGYLIRAKRSKARLA